ncbi:MAG: proton-conducting transporter membrane subunit [Acidobacteriota bacterium]|nr:proton-conducting transporter membrane subunit [Acidobacteriota bacterium]
MLLLLIIGGLFTALITPVICSRFPKKCGYLLSLQPFAVALYLLRHAPSITGGEPLRYKVEWLPSLGLSLSFYIDGLALLFALMVSIIGGVILIYARPYLGKHPDLTKFYVVLQIFISAMLGVVCSGNLLGLFVFWELTGITSFLLIGFDHEKKSSRTAALQALLITTAGSLAMFAGLLIMGQAGGFELETLLAGDGLQRHSLYLPILLLVLAGAFTKSAQFPFHFWLPRAMAAPTPISAYLHSATMVKLGVFLLARLYPVLGETAYWELLLMGFGGATMIMGGWRSPFQDDLKAVLAYSTLSVLGMLVFALGMGGPYGLTAMVLLTLAHSLYKAPLFLVAGNLDHETGTRSIAALSGLRDKLPLTFAVGLTASVSMIGLPPTLGFVSKEVLLEAAWKHSPLAVTAITVTAIGLVAAAWTAGLKPFRGPPKPTPRSPHEAPAPMWSGPLVLALGGLLLGAAVGLLKPLYQAAASAVSQDTVAVSVSLWHGFTPPLFTSMSILLMGAVVIASFDKLSPLMKLSLHFDRIRPSRIYLKCFDALFAFAARITRMVQSDSLGVNLSIILWTFLLLGGGVLWRLGGLPGQVTWEPKWLEIVLGSLMAAAALGAVFAKAFMGSAILLGMVGFSMSAVFMLYGAVDLAITQIVVDTLTVLMLVLVVHKLPHFKNLSRARNKLHDAILSISCGLFVTLLILKAEQVDFQQSISVFYNDHSVPDAYGRNIVNVILVDFRALDTLGEITVLATAAMGVILLLRGNNDKRGGETS